VAQPPVQPPEARPSEQPSTPSDLTQPPSDLGLDQQRFAGLGGEGVSLPNMIGDMMPFTPQGSTSNPSASPATVTTTAIRARVAANVTAQRALAAVVRSSLFKVAVNENVRPEDRVYFTYNGFFNVNDRVNAANGVDVGTINLHTETVGLEKTFFDRNASIGLRLPLDTLTATDGITPGSGGTFTDIGDLTITGKLIVWEARNSGSLISAGLAVTVPTGSDTFAGSPTAIIDNFHDTLLQPFVGYVWSSGAFYVHGFESVQVPTDSNDVTLLFTDIGAGYSLLRRTHGDNFLTAVEPTAEAHLNDFLDHRSGNFKDWLVLVQGVTFEFRRHSLLTLAIGEPVTGPIPYDVEAVVQFNLRF
jgi:hypothetical protein